MKFLADENISLRTVKYLQSLNYDIRHVTDFGLRGFPDEDIIKFAKKENRILITMDLDFADIKDYPVGTHAGIIVFRLAYAPAKIVNGYLAKLLKLLEKADITGKLVIADKVRYRIRK